MMSTHTLHRFTRWVTLWFVLSLGVAVASPLVQPRVISMVCSAAGVMALLVQTDEGAVPLGSHTLDCPLCANLGAPPPALPLLPAASQPPCLQVAAPHTPLRGMAVASAGQARAPPTLH